jgi:hypothetical protein
MSMLDPDTQHLEDIAQLVHKALRKLKIDEQAQIVCHKFKVDEVREYVIGYSYHKKKWFKAKYDPATRVLTCTRGAPPPWPLKDKNEDPDEP